MVYAGTELRKSEFVNVAYINIAYMYNFENTKG